MWKIIYRIFPSLMRCAVCKTTYNLYAWDNGKVYCGKHYFRRVFAEKKLKELKQEKERIDYQIKNGIVPF